MVTLALILMTSGLGGNPSPNPNDEWTWDLIVTLILTLMTSGLDGQLLHDEQITGLAFGSGVGSSLDGTDPVTRTGTTLDCGA